MKQIFWIKLDARKNTPKVSKGKPGVDWNEIAMRLEINLPDALFSKPALEAVVTIPESVVMTPTIQSETVLNVQSAIETATGMEVRISLVPQETE